MNYQDFAYGRADIDEPVLVELMSTAAMQRLNGILQHGITGFLGTTRPITRFEHSVGVMLLARHFKAPLTEQIAALLHDVSHTAFSHVPDHFFSRPTGESFYEIMKETYLGEPDIPKHWLATDTTGAIFWTIRFIRFWSSLRHCCVPTVWIIFLGIVLL